MSTTALHIRFAPEQKELVISQLLDEGIESFQEGRFSETEDGSIVDEDVLLICYFPTEEEAYALRDSLVATFPHGLGIELQELGETNWQEAWKEFSSPTEISPKLRVRASFHQETQRPGQHEIIIDAESAFGTGSHPTTMMCLSLLEEAFTDLAQAPRSMLDVGCGSGVLSIAADHFGATEVLGIDITPEAITASVHNAKINKAQCCQFSESPLENVPGQFDIVIANILSNTLISLWPTLSAHLAPGGKLIVSGLLVEEKDHFLKAIDSTPNAQRVIEGWLSLVFTR